MKPFNLKEYLENPKKEIVTRDGRRAKILCTNFHQEGFPVIAEIEEDDLGVKKSLQYTPNGFNYRNGLSGPQDLFFVTKKYEGWINLYKSNGVSWLSPCYFTTKEEAEKEGKNYPCCVTTIKIEWEE